MKTKALLLGALPIPGEGEWIPIMDGESWNSRSEGFPPDVKIGMDAHIEVELSNGAVVPLPLHAQGFSGRRARAVIDNPMEGVRCFSVFVEETR